MPRSTDPAVAGEDIPDAIVTLDSGEAVRVVRGPDGRWCFAGTPVEVPGAVDRTLGESVEVLLLSRPDAASPESVVVSATAVADPRLHWISDVAVPFGTGAEKRYEVPWAVWQEHAAEAIGIKAPEAEGRGLSRMLAASERRIRFARWELEKQTQQRARLVAIAVALGMTRREISAVLGVSAGRVQQLVEDLPPQVRVEVDSFLTDAERVLRVLGSGEVRRDALPASLKKSLEVLDELSALDLVVERAGMLSLTEAGDSADLHLRLSRRKGGSRGR